MSYDEVTAERQEVIHTDEPTEEPQLNVQLIHRALQ